MYEFSNSVLMKARYSILLAEAETARFRIRTQTGRPRPQSPVLIGVANLLVSLGTKLKGKSGLGSPAHSLRTA